jgi:hypothetical protein
MMSIFGNILSSIFSNATAAEAPKSASAEAAPASSSSPSSQKSSGQQTASAPQASGSSGGTATATKAAPSGPVDIAAILDDLTRRSGEKDIQWRKSIVDLMKILKLDSGLAARRQLAKELNYSGSTKDTEAMNIWLHKQVMTKLGENGGIVPEELKH